MSRHLCSIGGALLLGASYVPAFAADEMSAEQPAAAATPATAPGTAPALQEIVVTATRRAESLQAVPVTVSAVTSDSLQKAGALDVRSLTFIVPGFVGGRNFGVLQPALRGVGSTGNSLGDESNIAIYVDGVYQPNAIGNILDFPVVDRVEVLHGPQGTLFGRNATGGLVNVITPDPKFETGGEFGAQYGRFHGADSVKLRGYATTPLSDKVAVNLMGTYAYSGNYLDDLVRGGKIGKGESYAGRGKILFEPSDSSQIIVTVGYSHQQGGNGNIVQPWNGSTMGNLVPGAPRPKTPFQTALTFVPELWVNQFTASLRTHFEIGPVVLETTSAYMHDHVHQKSDTDGSPVIASQNLFLQDTDRSQSHEVRFLSDTSDKFKWILGAFFYDMKGDVKTTGDNANPPTFTPVVTSVRTPEATVQSMAVFGEATLALTDRLRVTGGLRYTTENRSWAQFLNGRVLVPRQKTSYDKATYRGIIQYEFAEKSNIFVSYSTGFKSGLFNTFGSTPSDRVDPETIDAWEVGVKSDPLPWLRTNFSAFHYNYKNLQVVARVPDAFGAVSYRLLNAASSKIYGGEVEIQALLPAGFSIAASGSYLHARYDHFPGAQIFIPQFQNGVPVGNAITTGDASDNHMIKAPDYTLSLQVDWNHKFDNGSGVGANVSVYRSDTVYYDFQNRMNQPAYTRLNASASYTLPGERLTFTVYGNNITDEAIIQQGSPTVNVDQVTYERPREVGVRADFRF